MSLQTEKVLKELSAIIDAHEEGFNSEKDLDALIQKFLEEKNAKASFGAANFEPETADDYLELADETDSRKERLEYLNKALALEPDNLDAMRMKATLTTKHFHEFLEELSKLLKKGTRQMEKEGFFADDCRGNFWGIVETRPYMRLRHAYMRTLMECRMLRRAAEECEEMLALCEDDNLGVRYDLMHLYAMLEEEKPARAVMEKFHSEKETQMLLPFSILHFKLGHMDEALSALKRLSRVNKDTKKFLKAMMSEDIENVFPEMSPYGYRASCIEELFVEISSYPFLFENAFPYFDWAYQALKKRPAKK